MFGGWFSRAFGPEQGAQKTDQLKNPFDGVKGLEVTEDTVSFLGVEIERREGGVNTPRLERFEGNVLREFDLKLMQKIAVALELNQPVLIESGSGLGKSETVERMCALANWECYYANCNDFDVDALIGGKTVREDTVSGFGWKDGVVLQAIRNGGVLFLDEYNFMRGETRGRLHEILDSILRGKDHIVLTENDGERVPVHPDFRLVGAQNPPGGMYRDREYLDPAQFSRFIYLKEPSEMPAELKEARALGAFNLAKEVSISDRDFLGDTQAVSREELSEHPDLKHYLTQYLEFERGLEKLVYNGTIGAEQPQPIYFAFQRDFNRVIDFMSKFYDGDLEGSLKKALYFYYENRFESQSDRDKVRQLVNTIAAPEPPDSKRQVLDPEKGFIPSADPMNPDADSSAPPSSNPSGPSQPKADPATPDTSGPSATPKPDNGGAVPRIPGPGTPNPSSDPSKSDDDGPVSFQI
jgi:hypothetical protein